MKDIDRALSVFFLCVAVAALLLHDPTFALASGAMAGIFRIEYEKER